MINFLGILFAVKKMNLIIYFYEINRLYIIHFFNSSFLCSRKESCFLVILDPTGKANLLKSLIKMNIKIIFQEAGN